MREIRPQLSFRDFPKMPVPFSGGKTYGGATWILEWGPYCIVADFHPLTVEQVDKIRAGWKLDNEPAINHLSLGFFDTTHPLDETASPVCVLSAQGGHSEAGVALCDNQRHPRSLMDWVTFRRRRPKSARLTIFLHDQVLDMGLAKDLPYDRLAAIASLSPLPLLKLGADVLESVEAPKFVGEATNGWRSVCLERLRDAQPKRR